MSKGYVYIGYDRNGLFKIGMTKDHHKRLKQIQNINPAFEMLCAIPVDNYKQVEVELHNRFQNKRMIGEWFRLSADDIQAIVYEYTGNDVPIEEIEKHWKYGVGQDLF